MKVLLLIRGAPGSGKTTIANHLVKSGLFDVSWEADLFFYTEDRNYLFVPEQILAAHEWCRRKVNSSMEMGRQVIVSNTFTDYWQMKPYYDMASYYEYQVQEMILPDPVFKNIHGVPQEKVDEMQNRLWKSIKECYSCHD